MKERVLLTRQQIEYRLERGLVGKIVLFEKIDGTSICARLKRLAVEEFRGELMVSFMLDNFRFEVDLQYFVENITIQYGDTYTGHRRSVRRILKED